MTRWSRSLVLRRHSAGILRAVIVDATSLATLLPGGLEGLDSRERAWVQALIYTVLRWYPRVDAMLASLLSRPLPPRDAIVRVLLLQGLTELHHFRTPDHAAISETAELARALGRPRAVGLINAVLRRSQREREALNARLDRAPVSRFACPEWLIEAIRSGWPGDWESILASSTEQAPLTLRINRLRASRESVLDECRAAGLAVEPHPEVPTAVQLASAVDVEAIPGFPEGRVSVQDAAAQWAAPLLDAHPGMSVLDACAAPGGKTTHLLEATQGRIRLTALDIEAGRIERVRSNLERLGLSARLLVGDLRELAAEGDTHGFDRILLDVPCSATGTIRRHPDLKLLRRAEDIPRLAAQQQDMLDHAARLLAPQGMILYATCSLLPAENEQVVGPWLDRNPGFRVEPAHFPGACSRPVGSATIMGREGMDGFYYALLRR